MEAFIMLNLKRDSIIWSLNHIRKFQDTNIFPFPFEYLAIFEFENEVISYLESLDIYSAGVRPYRTALVPKSQVGFRIATQLDPLDAIITNAVIYEIHEELEKTRIDCSNNRVFSYRLKPEDDGTLYNPEYSWDAFNNLTDQIANSGEYDYITITDIADFFPSIYLHDIETNLREAVAESGKFAHAQVLINLIKAMHGNQTHKGLPIGPLFSRPIAEIILNDIDKQLQEQGVQWLRYVDDYRIFCKTKQEAYSVLAFLAQSLYDLRNFKLNENKTKILTIQEFKRQYPRVFKSTENDRIIMQFEELFERVGISSSIYDDIDEDLLVDLYSEREFEELNSIVLLRNELDERNIDYGFINFLINNLSRFDNTELAEYILADDNITNLFPVLRSIINYFERVRSFSAEQKRLIGRQVLELLLNSYICGVEFNRAWLLHLFTKNEEWNNKEYFSRVGNVYQDQYTQRELMLCLGRSRNIDYFRRNRFINISQFDPWVKRAFIAGISCLPKDEREPWYKNRALFDRDFLDILVEKWAIKNHF